MLGWKQAQRAIFPNLKPTLKSISLCLPESMLNELRQLANERDIPYQSLIKHFLRERIDQEYKAKNPNLLAPPQGGIFCSQTSPPNNDI